MDKYIKLAEEYLSEINVASSSTSRDKWAIEQFAKWLDENNDIDDILLTCEKCGQYHSIYTPC